MRALSLFITLFLFQNQIAQFNPFILDTFADHSKHTDLSGLIIRKDQEQASSAFEITQKSDVNGLTFKSINVKSEALGLGGYNYNNGDYMTHICIDYPFPEVIDRTDGDTIIIEFDALWDQIDGSGESGRMVVFFIHEYPEGGPTLDAYKDITKHHFGRPAYNLRILNGSYAAFMVYGGGNEEEGIFEIIQNGNYWLPGFSSQPGGGTIGMDEDYPLSPSISVPDGTNVASHTVWKHYTWILAPERLEFYARNSAEEEGRGELLMFMEIPEDGNVNQVNDAHGSIIASMPLYYHWFDEINAVRFFWRAAKAESDCYLANVRISKDGTPLSTYVEFSRHKVVVDESDGSYSIELSIENPSDETDTRCIVSLVTGHSELVNEFANQEIVFPAGTSEGKNLELTISGDEDALRDTLEFEITEVSGGNLAAIGPRKYFTLIINDSPQLVDQLLLSGIIVYPNPTNGLVNVDLSGTGLIRCNAQIISLTGQTILNKELNLNDKLDVHSLQPGLYILQLSCGRIIHNRILNVVD